MMTDFVKALLESTAEDGDMNTNDNVQVEESSTPISTLIESAFADFDIAMINAMEVYEMACVIGGVKVVSEGAGQTEAAALLEAASGNFFGKIADFFRKIGKSIADLWNKIVAKIKTIGKNSQKMYNKYRAAALEKVKKAKSDGKTIPFPAEIKFINVESSEKEFASIINDISTTWADIDKSLGEDFNGDWSDDKKSNIVDTDWSISNVFGKIVGKKLADDATIETVKEYVAKKYELENHNPDLDERYINLFTKTVDLAASEEVAGAGKLCKMIEQGAKKLEKMADAYSKKAPDGDAAKTFFTAAQKMISTMSNVALTIVNTRAAFIINAATGYANYIKSVATGKIGPKGEEAPTGDGSEGEQQTATDGVDYSMFFESYDILEEGCAGEDCDDEDEGDDDVLEGGCKKKSSMESQSIVDIARMLV